MKLQTILLSLAVAVGCVSCGGTQPGSAASSGNSLTDPTPVSRPGDTPAAQGSGRPAGSTNSQRLDGDAPPVDAKFTLFCEVYRGPEHILQASQTKDMLVRSTGLRSWHILHTEQESSLYFGYYRTFNDREHDPAEVNRAQADAHQLATLKDAEGAKLFKTLVFVPVDAPDPDAPPQWDLARAPADAYWSLQVGAYMGSPDRKKAAVNAVREARANGVDAYYFHGDTISSVCVGAFPKEAIKSQDTAVAGTVDPNAVPLVTNDVLPPLSASEMRDADGNRVVIQAPKLQVLDPRLAQAIRLYPNHAVNGEVHFKTLKDGSKLFDPSFIVLVPHPDNTPAPMVKLDNPTTPAQVNPVDQATSNILDDSRTLAAPRGTLRSMGN